MRAAGHPRRDAARLPLRQGKRAKITVYRERFAIKSPNTLVRPGIALKRARLRCKFRWRRSTNNASARAGLLQSKTHSSRARRRPLVWQLHQALMNQKRIRSAVTQHFRTDRQDVSIDTCSSGVDEAKQDSAGQGWDREALVCPIVNIFLTLITCGWPVRHRQIRVPLRRPTRQG